MNSDTNPNEPTVLSAIVFCTSPGRSGNLSLLCFIALGKAWKHIKIYENEIHVPI